MKVVIDIEIKDEVRCYEIATEIKSLLQDLVKDISNWNITVNVEEQ